MARQGRNEGEDEGAGVGWPEEKRSCSDAWWAGG